MKKIEKPSGELYSFTNDEESIVNLKNWIDILTKPFKQKGISPKCIHVSSLLEEATALLLPDSLKDIVRIDFPTTVSGLYLKLDGDYDDEGSLILSIENRARLVFSTNNHSVERYKGLYSGKAGEVVIEGTWEEVSKEYFRYLNELMKVPLIH